MGEETIYAEQSAHSLRSLLQVTYNCDDDAIGPKDEWVAYSGKLVPKVGDFGFGRTTCYQHLSWQSCDEVDCFPDKGIVDLVESYSKERAGKLGLEK